MTPAALLGFDLLRPSTLALLGLPLLLLLIGLVSLARRSRQLELFFAARHRGRLLAGYAPGRARTRLVCAALAGVSVVCALSGPVRGYTDRQLERRGLDLVVCIDTSRSMLVRDLRPSRLERARREVAGLLQRLRGDRVALLAFAGDVREVTPLTHDRNALQGFLENVSPVDNRLGGTDLGTALEAALERFDGRTGSHEAVLLLTDGEDHEGRALAAADEAARRGIRVYVVGMASAGGGKIPLLGADGSESFLRDAEGQEVVSRLDEPSLRAIAEATGGDYLGADASPTPLEEIYEKRIARLEGREYGVRMERVPHDRFQWFLVAALVCMVVEGGLRERRGGRA